jgi:hypothetical protein
MRTKSVLSLALLGACASAPERAPRSERSTPLDERIAALSETKILAATDAQKRIDAAIDGWFSVAPTARGYIMVDKPIYQPGETIWFRSFFRQTNTLGPAQGYMLTARLISPRGATVAEKHLSLQSDLLTNDVVLPPEIEGGEYKLVMTTDDGRTHERAVIVSVYEAPRLKKQLEFVKKAYGAGDAVSASFSVARATGEPFAEQTVTAVVVLDGAELKRFSVKTDAAGKASVRFELPASVGKGDGLLTVLADDAGVVESIQKRIPILTGALDFQTFAEGGDLVNGLPGRVYFAARNTLGKPADVEGRIVDEAGVEIVRFKSFKQGMGRFELSPTAGKRYTAEITKPVGITQKFALPVAKAEGCVLRSAPRTDGVAMVVYCRHPETVTLEAVLREQRVASASIDVARGEPALVVLPVDEGVQGAVRVTVFDQEARPLAERLVYRGLGRDLSVSITADKKSYSPRDPVTLTVRTKNLSGKPVPASLALSVVDDTVLSFADDKSAHILSRLYLEPELGNEPVEEPNTYFAGNAEAAVAMDMLMGTRGWRRFDWQPVFAPPVPAETSTSEAAPTPDVAAAPPEPRMEPARPRLGAFAPKKKAPAPAKPVAIARPAAPPPPPRDPVAKNIAPAQQPVGRVQEKEAKQDLARGARARRAPAAEDDADEERFAGEEMAERRDWAAVRVFPAPVYDKGYDGPRTDFRETIFWAPQVKTGADGTAQVTFHLSDAVTSFRATAEGLSDGGLPGRADAIVQSKMPLALDVRFPLEVSAGDEIQLPLTIANETALALEGKLTMKFGASLGGESKQLVVRLAPGEKKAIFHPLNVVGQVGEGDVEVVIETAGLRDEMKKAIRIVPAGFPFERSASGTVKTGAAAKHDFELGGALPGTITAEVTLYPSPVATMTQGAKGLIREPGGCFEQTSSSNYPNVMVLRYLQSNDDADPELVDKTQAMLGRGYKILTGYETKQKGYEWFGHSPPHEALSAYGLMEFEDMKPVHDVDNEMIQRTATWLLSRRDGKGGFQRSSQALDSFGRANEATTNGYIVWALTEAKRGKDLPAELAAQKKVGLASSDPYLVGLAANSLLNTDAAGADTKAVVTRLAGLQAKDGSFPGAAQTITMSGDKGKTVEATSLAVLALIKASPKGEYDVQTRAAVDWLNANRGGWGEWSSTQGTIMSLKALTAHAEHSKQIATSGTAILVVNGKEVGKLRFEKGHKGALVFTDVAAAMRAGKNDVELRIDTQDKVQLPYSVAISYRSKSPDTSAAAKVAVTAEWTKTQVPVGESVRVKTTVTNKSASGQPMTLARIGVPGGMTFQTWQLKELQDKGAIDFYETRPREVILYFRALAPNAVKQVDLDLIARIPGTYEAPASQAYLYYTPEERTWVAPATVTVANK